MGTLEESILTFLYNKKPTTICKAPARINLINPLDAVEADYWAPAVAIGGVNNPLSAYCYIKKLTNAENSQLFYYNCPRDFSPICLEKKVSFKLKDLLTGQKLTSEDKHDIFRGSLIYLFQNIPEFHKCLQNQEIEIGVITSIPRQSGIAGSSALIIGLLWAIGCYCGFDHKNPKEFTKIPFNRDIIGELSTEIENKVLQNTAGYGDRYTIARGGLGFTSYVGKLLHPSIGDGPLAVYDRIDQTYQITQIPIILAYSGVNHTSGDIHSVLRKKYLEKDITLLNAYKDLAEVAWKSRLAMMKHDWHQLGKLFRQNTTLSEKIMQHCGFKFGIGWANKVLIDILENHPHVHAVKLSGAGGGGSVFALVDPKYKREVRLYWEQELHKRLQTPELIQSYFGSLSIDQIEQLKKAEFFEVIINSKGVQKLNFSQ